MAEPGPLRVALLCSGTTLPYWQAQAVRHLLELPGVQIVAMGTPSSFGEPVPTGGLRAYLEHRALHLLSRTASRTEDLTDPLGLVPGVDLASSTGPIDLHALTAYRPDLIFSFLPILSTSGGAVPLLEFRFGGRGLHSNGMPGLQASFTREQELVVRFGPPDGSEPVEASFPLRDENDRPTIDRALLGAAWLPAKAISLFRSGMEDGPGSTSIKYIEETDKEVSIVLLIRTWLALEIRHMSPPTRADHGEEWNLGILHQPITSLLDEGQSMNVRWLPAPSEGNHRLEPFGYTAPDGQLNVLYRKKHRNSEIDAIARLRPKSDSVLKRSRSMLSTSVSLHYPYVVERPDGVFAVISYPHQGRTELFRVAPTNDGLDHVKVLLDRVLISPSLIYFEGRWWLFGTDPDAPDMVLLAYHSAHFEGPYVPHALNPLRVAASGVRPAGTLFLRGNELWRPALDTTDPASVAVVLNQVNTLTTSTFHEEPVKRIAGFRGTVYGKGIRTLSAMGDITLIDGMRGSNAEKKPEQGHKKSHHGRHKSKGK